MKTEWIHHRQQLATDPEAVEPVLLLQLETALADKAFDAMIELLRDPTFHGDAETHRAVGHPALRAIGVLAWRRSEAAQLLAAYASLPYPRTISFVEGELELAARWRRGLGASSLHSGPLRPAHVEEFPDALLSLIGDAALSSPRRRRALYAELDGMLRDPRRLLRALDRIVGADRRLAFLLLRRFHAETPLGARQLDRLPREIFEGLGQGLVDLERSMRAPLRPWMLAAGAVGGVAAVMTAVVPIALGASVVIGSAGIGSLKVGLARRRYLARVRPGIAALIARLGVQSDNVRAWLAYNRRLSGDLATYDIAVDSDGGLSLLGGIATLVREQQRKALAASG